MNFGIKINLGVIMEKKRFFLKHLGFLLLLLGIVFALTATGDCNGKCIIEEGQNIEITIYIALISIMCVFSGSLLILWSEEDR